MGKYDVGSSSFTMDNLVLEGPIAVDSMTVKMGNVLKRGQLFIMASGLAVVDPGTDPSLVYGIAAEDVDATAKDVKSVGYISGNFSKSAIIFPAGKNYSHYKEPLRNKGITLR